MGAEEEDDKSVYFNHVLYCRQVVRVRVCRNTILSAAKVLRISDILMDLEVADIWGAWAKEVGGKNAHNE